MILLKARLAVVNFRRSIALDYLKQRNLEDQQVYLIAKIAAKAARKRAKKKF